MRTRVALFKGVVVSLFLSGMVALSSPAHAAGLVTTSQLNAQGVAVQEKGLIVQEKTVEMLQEYVKYLQMSLIRQLEAKIAMLKAQR